MQLDNKAIRRFKELYRLEFNADISDDEAQELGWNLIRLFQIIYRPMPDKREPKAPEDARTAHGDA